MRRPGFNGAETSTSPCAQPGEVEAFSRSFVAIAALPVPPRCAPRIPVDLVWCRRGCCTIPGCSASHRPRLRVSSGGFQRTARCRLPPGTKALFARPGAGDAGPRKSAVCRTITVRPIVVAGRKNCRRLQGVEVSKSLRIQGVVASSDRFRAGNSVPALRSPSWTVNASCWEFMSAIRFGTPTSACSSE